MRRHSVWLPSQKKLLFTFFCYSAVFFGEPRSLAHAQHIAFQPFAQTEGLTNLGFSCLKQDGTGYILACSEHGLYAYDGQRFFNLGPQQGLPEGGIIRDLAFGPRGNLILRYSDRIFVSQAPLSLSNPPEALSFRAAISHIGPIYNDRNQQIVPWRDGAIIIDRKDLHFIDIGDGSSPPVIRDISPALKYPPAILHKASSVYGLGDSVWVASEDGHICSLGHAEMRCLGPNQGLPNDNWSTFLDDGQGHLLTRSALRLSTIDVRNDTLQIENLPRQTGTDYSTYVNNVTLTLTPSGGILTQSVDGLIIRDKSGWRALTTANGLPPVPLTSVLFDHEGDLWLAASGRGVLKALGYGLWENWDHRDGLSSDYVWQITRQPGGPIWVSTDHGVDAVDHSSSKTVSRAHYPFPSYAIASGSFGHIWRSMAPSGVSCISTATGEVRQFAMPAVSQIIHGTGNRLWITTEDGIYVVDDGAATPPTPERLAGIAGSVAGGAVSADGSLWLLQRGQLLHRNHDGTLVTVVRDWGQPGFEPLAITMARPDQAWIGGAGGGLYRVDVVADHVHRIKHFGPPDILSNTVVAVLADRRGWIWTGTDNGISVFDGKRWVSADMGNGLIWNDIDQDGMFEDTDGSVWIATSQGLSHLVDPARLFAPQKLQPVITSVTLGDKRMPDHAVPYSQEPLSLRFGDLDSRSNVRFRYRLDGVDRTWAETSAGDARYPSLPPGRHRFEVIATDPLTHQSSPPVSVMLRMTAPWWLWWPLQALYGLSAFALIYGVWRLRYRYLLRQQRILHREVELRTREIHAAQAALVLQATQDSLTKLLTRGEIQKRLVDALARKEPSRALTIGLADIDHFKQINDHFGHLAGDEILGEMGRRLKAALRSGEHGGRYGGEEILLVINDSGENGVSRIRELKLAICGEAFVIENEPVRVTCSIGVAQAHPGDTWKSLIGRADKALYHAKAQGRNRVIEAEDAAPGWA